MELVIPISQDRLEQIRRLVGASTYRAGQVIFYEGHNPAGFYVLFSGKIALKHINGEAREDIAEIVSPCRALGLHCLLKDKAYPLTAEAVEDCEVAYIDKTTFLEWLSHEHSVLQGIIPKPSPNNVSGVGDTLRLQNLLLWFRQKSGFVVFSLCLAVAGGLYCFQSRSPEFPIAAAIQDDHMGFVSGQVKPELASREPLEIVGWFRDKLDVPILLPSLFKSAQFIGARLCWFKGKNPVAYFMGHKNGHAISLFAFNPQHFRFPKGQKIELQGKDFSLVERDKYRFVLWKDGGTAYVLLSDLGPTAALALASGGNGT